MSTLENPIELGRRIAAARGYAGLDLPEFGELLGVDADQVRRWEAGLGQGDLLEERRVLGERIAEASGAPRELFGLSEHPYDLIRRIEVLEAELAKLSKLVQRSGEPGGRLGLVREK